LLTDLAKPGGGLGWVSALDVEGRTIWIVDAHGYGKRFIVRADEILTAFVELQRAIHEFVAEKLTVFSELESQLIRTPPMQDKAPCIFY
jgi:hypothetical protein